MKLRVSLVVVLGLLVACVVLVVACGSNTPAPCPTCAAGTNLPCPTAAACPACPTAAACPTSVSVAPTPTATGVTTPTSGTVACPFQDQWASSPHAAKTAAAFTHWNEDTPPEIPNNCAKCHSPLGYVDYVAGVEQDLSFALDKSYPVGGVVDCNACHNAYTEKLTVIPFPSTLTVTVTGPEGRCMVCHQGRTSGSSVTAAIGKAGLTDLDTVTPTLSFTNVHYRAAAATLYGTWVKGGFEYPDKAYDVRFDHVQGLDTCVQCHNQHTLELNLTTCAECHSNVKTAADLWNIRMQGSEVDYNGNGNTTEGLYYEVKGLRDMLYTAIQEYAKEVSKSPIVYDENTNPYFFADTNGNGKLDEGEQKYTSFTGRLAEAAYNYQFSVKDPGAYAHNGKYVIELLYDSIDSLNEKITTKVDLTNAHRESAGHFDSASPAFRDWDAAGVTGMTEPGCMKCHNGNGLPQFLENNANVAEPVTSRLYCSTCHDEKNFPARYEVTSVTFPSGAALDTGNLDSNLCIECHQGRSSTVAVNKAIAGKPADTPDAKIRFLNVHYLPAGATLFGTDAKGAYEFDGQVYLGRLVHVDAASSCTQCHDVHTGDVNVSLCKGCHTNVQTAADLENIRMSSTDYDGNGNATEGIAVEVANMRDALYKAIQAYAKNKLNAPIVYSSGQYPYFFADSDDNGQADEGEPQYSGWTPRLLQAAYNLQFVNKEPGAFAHNPKYIIQVLYDSIKDIGGDVSKMTRPK